MFIIPFHFKSGYITVFASWTSKESERIFTRGYYVETVKRWLLWYWKTFVWKTSTRRESTEAFGLESTEEKNEKSNFESMSKMIHDSKHIADLWGKRKSNGEPSSSPSLSLFISNEESASIFFPRLKVFPVLSLQSSSSLPSLFPCKRQHEAFSMNVLLHCLPLNSFDTFKKLSKSPLNWDLGSN